MARRWLIAAPVAFALAGPPLAGQGPAVEPAIVTVASSVPIRGEGALAGQSFATAGLREALLVPTISAFAGKSGMVRMYAGVVAPVVVLTSQPAGCGRIQGGLPPIMTLTKKTAAAMAARLETTRPRASFPFVQFTPTREGDFEKILIGTWDMDKKQIQALESDRRSRPYVFEQIVGPTTDGRLSFRIFSVASQRHGQIPILEQGGDGGFFELWREGEQVRVGFDAAILGAWVGLSGRVSVPLQVCPPLEHLHIEPR